ncbi:hypothetical protein UlMin_023392 [Ulmus minor]
MATKSTRIAVLFYLLLAFIVDGEAKDFDVRTYGARPNGDIGLALAKAWKDACASPTPSKVVIPSGIYNLKVAKFEGPCKAPIVFQLQGTLKAQTNPSGFNEGEGWITFLRIDKLTLTGGGTFDGQGKNTWGKQCSSTKYCNKLPMNIRFDFITNSLVENIVSLDSKQFHINVLGGEHLTFSSVKIIAPGTSANTDGIHIGRSTSINITDSFIQTGDDCISIGDGSRQITITKVTCGPGHGISVGSLGKYPKEEPVQGVFVRNCTLKNTMNGIRIKTWPDSYNGVASDMHFEDIIMENVGSAGNPIVIDQAYCPWNKCNAQIPSKVRINNVSFKKIRGSSATAVAVKLACSKSFPCQNVQISDINLTYSGKEGPVKSQCQNVKPTILGQPHPALCIA